MSIFNFLNIKPEKIGKCANCGFMGLLTPALPTAHASHIDDCCPTCIQAAQAGVPSENLLHKKEKAANDKTDNL